MRKRIIGNPTTTPMAIPDTIVDLGTFEYSSYIESPENNKAYVNAIDNATESGIYKFCLEDVYTGYKTYALLVVTCSDMVRTVQVMFTPYVLSKNNQSAIVLPRFRVQSDNLDKGEPEWSPWEDIIGNAIKKIDDKLDKSERNVIWSNIQNSGQRTDYNYAFGSDVQKDVWNDKTFFPVFDIKPTNANRMFKLSNMTNIKQRLIDCGVTLDFSNCTNLAFAFQAVKSKELPEINASKVSNTLLIGLFQNSTSLESVDKLILSTSGTTEFTNSFSSCSKLEHIIIEGVIGRTISFSACPLDVDSMVDIILHLKNYAGTSEADTYKLMFKSDCWDAIKNVGIDPIIEHFTPALDDFNGVDITDPDRNIVKEMVMALGWLVS